MPTVVMLFLAALCIAASSFSEEFIGKVVEVIDGDSLRVMHKGRAEQICLCGIDFHENGQALGERAKRATSDLAFGRQVIVCCITSGTSG